MYVLWTTEVKCNAWGFLGPTFYEVASHRALGTADFGSL